MRKKLLISAVLLAAMILSPLTAMDRHKTVQTAASAEKQNKNTVSILLSEKGTVIETGEREYIIGVLAAEADMTCHEEALKAQAVAYYTYLKYNELNGSTEKFGGADISDDTKTCQGYLDPEGRKEKWGDKYEEYEKLAEKVADEISGKIITYNDEPILAVYHELSGGITESAETVWGKDYPYLQSVESAGDRLSADYSKTVVLTEDEFKDYAKKLDGAKLSDDIEEWITLDEVNENGYVKKLTVGEKSFTGEQFRNAFGLNSCNFTVKHDEERFTVRTLGKGHMVGMSCYGADYMARQGSDYEQILAYYYKNTEIV